MTPLGVAGLTPLDDIGLTPLDATGLTPLDDIGLTPLDAAGLTPLDDPFAALGNSANPFADPLGVAAYPGVSAGTNPYQSPSVVSSGKTARRRRSSGDFGYGEVLSCTWYTFWDNWGSCLLLSLTLLGLYLGVAILFGVANMLLALILRPLPPIPAAIVGLAILLAGFVFLVLIGFTVQAGLIRITVNMVKGKEYSIAALLQEGSYAFSLLGAGLLQGLIGIGLGLLLAVPIVGLQFLFQSVFVVMIGQLLGFVLNVLVTVLLLLTPYLIVDQDSGVFDAISTSASTMTGNVLVTIGLIVTAMLGVAVFIGVTLGLGILLAMPFFMILVAAIYAKATGQKTVY